MPLHTHTALSREHMVWLALLSRDLTRVQSVKRIYIMSFMRIECTNINTCFQHNHTGTDVLVGERNQTLIHASTFMLCALWSQRLGENDQIMEAHLSCHSAEPRCAVRAKWCCFI